MAMEENEKSTGDMWQTMRDSVVDDEMGKKADMEWVKTRTKYRFLGWAIGSAVLLLIVALSAFLQTCTYNG